MMTLILIVLVPHLQVLELMEIMVVTQVFVRQMVLQRDDVQMEAFIDVLKIQCDVMLRAQLTKVILQDVVKQIVLQHNIKPNALVIKLEVIKDVEYTQHIIVIKVLQVIQRQLKIIRKTLTEKQV